MKKESTDPIVHDVTEDLFKKYKDKLLTNSTGSLLTKDDLAKRYAIRSRSDCRRSSFRAGQGSHTYTYGYCKKHNKILTITNLRKHIELEHKVFTWQDVLDIERSYIRAYKKLKKEESIS